MNNATNMKVLAKETMIYGLSSIIGKFLNYLLVPLYTYVLAHTADYGIVTNLYAWTALLLVILTYGTETGFFRFANKEGTDPQSVYLTTLLTVLSTSVLFAVACVIWRQPIADWMGYSDHASFIAMMAVTVAMDAFACIPFAYLRYQKKPLTFAGLKLLFVALNIGFNVFFLLYLHKNDIYYVFLSNVLATAIQTALLIPFTLPRGGTYSLSLLRNLLRYSLPLLVLGVAGIMNQTLDRIIFPYLYTGDDAQSQLGIYGACFKVAMVMMIFTQAFRYAYEPFVFAKHKDKHSVEAYADAMKYYIIFSLLILLGVIVYLDVFKYIIGPDYWIGLQIVPVVLWTYVFQGIYFNLSFWYKLTDQTRWGAYFSLIGLAITVTIQVLLVPHIGYWASCGSSLVCYLVIMLLSYYVGQRHLQVPYDFRRIAIYFALTLICMGVVYLPVYPSTLIKMIVGTILVLVYIAVFYRLDLRSLLKKS